MTETFPANTANGGEIRQPDITVSVRQTFGIDSDMQVPAFSEPDDHVPTIDESYIFDTETLQLDRIVNPFGIHEKIYYDDSTYKADIHSENYNNCFVYRKSQRFQVEIIMKFPCREFPRIFLRLGYLRTK